MRSLMWRWRAHNAVDTWSNKDVSESLVTCRELYNRHMPLLQTRFISDFRQKINHTFCWLVLSEVAICYGTGSSRILECRMGLRFYNAALCKKIKKLLTILTFNPWSLCRSTGLWKPNSSFQQRCEKAGRSVGSFWILQRSIWRILKQTR